MGWMTPPNPIIEWLLRFDYSDTWQREVAIRFWDDELPFKVYNVLELNDAKEKWTEEYITRQFHCHSGGGFGVDLRKGMREMMVGGGSGSGSGGTKNEGDGGGEKRLPRSRGHAQEVSGSFSLPSPC